MYPGQPAIGDRDQVWFPHPWRGGVCGVHGQTGQEGRRQQERKGKGRQLTQVSVHSEKPFHGCFNLCQNYYNLLDPRFYFIITKMTIRSSVVSTS